jgi:hypothetical protein
MNLLPYTKSTMDFSHGPKPAHVDRWLYYVDGGWTQGRTSNGRYYWKPDLYDLVEKFTELEEDRDAGKAGAHERLKSFRAQRILFADSIVEVSYMSSSTSCCNNSSCRAAPNLKNGQKRKHRHRPVILREEEPKDAKRE